MAFNTISKAAKVQGLRAGIRCSGVSGGIAREVSVLYQARSTTQERERSVYRRRVRRKNQEECKS